MGYSLNFQEKLYFFPSICYNTMKFFYGGVKS
jgi:hypothetical protein